MDGEAREVRFQDLIDEGLLHVNDGYRAKHSELGIGGPIFLRAVHLQDAGFDFDGVQYFQDDARERVTAKMAMPGDTVVTTKGNSTGRTGYVSESMPPFVYSPHLSFWRSLDRSKLKPLFLRYWARGPEFRDQLSGLKESTDMAPYLSLTDQRRLRITVPRPRTQEAVGNMLGALDDKIEANRALNETLEATCQALFRSWFVDFDPVVAKSEGRRPAHLTDEVAALYPDRLEDTPIGPVPAGWRLSTIGEEARVVGGSTPSTTVPEYWEGGAHHWITPKDLSLRPLPVVLETSRKITGRGLAKISSGLLPRGTVLLSSRAPIGYLAIAEVPLAVNQGFIAMVCDGALPPHFVVQWCAANMDEIMARAGGTTFAEISKANFRPIPVAVPDDAVLAAFEAVAKPIYATIRANLEEASTLAILRDTLLPRLLSGELRVRQAEQLVEEAV